MRVCAVAWLCSVTMSACAVGSNVDGRSANAITFGEADGNAHPNVGALMTTYRDGSPGFVQMCTGTLIAPRVFLTASHCTSYLEETGREAWVTFSASLSDPAAKFIHGTMFTHPEYRARQDDPHDIAVIVLDKKVTGITPAAIVPEGFYSALSAAELQARTWTNVGYGLGNRLVGGGEPTFEEPDYRQRSTSSFFSIQGAWLRLSQNPSLGDGGTCFGDSGGPNFDDPTGFLGAITITGDTSCRSTNVDYRLDTPSARAFLGQFIEL